MAAPFSSAIGLFVIGKSPIGVLPAGSGQFTKYLQRTQRLLGDETEQQWNIRDLQHWINHGRKRIAAESQCVRFLLPSSGSFATVNVAAGGHGYTSPPTVNITLPDAWGVGFTVAQITTTVSGGAVNSATIVVPGNGYVAPTVTLSGGGGVGAQLAFTLTPFLSTVANQEVYNFSDANQFLPTTMESIFALQNVSVSWGGIKPTMRHLDWSGFQAYLRAYNTQSTSWPAVWAQYGQGGGGAVYLNPIPSQVLQMEWDAYCIPSELDSDQQVEAIPYPWTDVVPYYAAMEAYISARNTDMANYFAALYRQRMKEANSWATVPVFPDFYTPDIA